MSTASTEGCNDESAAGTLLADLERRQDDVLAQLDALDQQLCSVLRGLGVTLLDDESAKATGGPVSGVAGSDEQAVGTEEAPRSSSGGFAKLPSQHLASAPAERAA